MFVRLTYLLLLLAGCPLVTSLDLNPRVEGFAKLVYLQYLDLADCVKISDPSLAVIAGSAPNLLQLYLRRCVNITGKF